MSLSCLRFHNYKYMLHNSHTKLLNFAFFLHYQNLDNNNYYIFISEKFNSFKNLTIIIYWGIYHMFEILPSVSAAKICRIIIAAIKIMNIELNLRLKQKHCYLHTCLKQSYEIIEIFNSTVDNNVSLEHYIYLIITFYEERKKSDIPQFWVISYPASNYKLKIKDLCTHKSMYMCCMHMITSSFRIGNLRLKINSHNHHISKN